MPKEVQSEFESMIKKNSDSKDVVNKVSSYDAEDCSQQEPLRNGLETHYGANRMNELEIVERKQWSVKERLSSAVTILKRRDVWKPLVILNSYFFFMQFSGVPILIAYAVNIMMSEGVSLDPYFATLLVGVVKLIAEFGAGFVQNRYYTLIFFSNYISISHIYLPNGRSFTANSAFSTLPTSQPFFSYLQKSIYHDVVYQLISSFAANLLHVHHSF